MDNEMTLYGIKNSNRTAEDFWGKNKFNSSFPVALANYMKDEDKKAVYISLDADLKPQTSFISIDEVYNAVGIKTDDLYFAFEHRYTPYQEHSYDTIDGIDLVVKSVSGDFLRPLEVKLTVLPDSNSSKKDESKWGSEIVIRSASTSYCALGIADALKGNMADVRKIFETDCSKIRNWENEKEMIAVLPRLVELLNLFERQYIGIQKPFLLQPIWKTQGQSPLLAENAFDIFVWSDLAFTRLFLNKCKIGKKQKINRYMRCATRLARFLFEFSRSGKVSLNDIYKQGTFDLQTDKEFAVSGAITNGYMSTSPRLIKPIVTRDELFDIILNGGEEALMPERRFDQSIYFTMKRKK